MTAHEQPTNGGCPAGDTRDISLSEFSSRDGTAFNLRLVKRRTLKVSATDLTAKKHDVETPPGRLETLEDQSRDAPEFDAAW